MTVKRRRLGQAGWLLAGLGLAVALVALGFALNAAWDLGGDARISVHGWIAMGLAVLFTGLLGGGLMTLAFHSSRAGYDDRVINREDPQ